MGRPAPPNKDLPSRRLRRRFPAQRRFRAASAPESTRSGCPVRRPCLPPCKPPCWRDYVERTLCLRNLSSTPALGQRSYRSIRFSGDDLGMHLTDRVAETYSQNRLTRILQDVDDLACRCLQIKMCSIGEQVNIRVAADNFSESFPELPIQETHDLSYPLQRDPLAPQLAYDCYFGEVLHGIKTAMSRSFGLDHSPLVPPLELAGGDAGQSDYFLRWKAFSHSSQNMFETICALNV